MHRSSRSQMFFKIDVSKNFANFKGKHLRRSLFLIKLQALRPMNCFSVFGHFVGLVLNLCGGVILPHVGFPLITQKR